MSVYFADKDPVEGIEMIVPARRILAFRSSQKEFFGGLGLGVNEQYSLSLASDADVVVQCGRMDVQRDNLAYIGLMGRAD